MNEERRPEAAPDLLPPASLAAVEDGAALLADVRAFFNRFLRAPDLALDVLAAWALHSHAIGAASSTPYVHLGSPEPRCGKSRALELLALIARDPLPTASATTAAIFRSLAARPRTILFDEVDALFRPAGRGADPGAEDMRALLNAGNRRGTPCLRCVGPQHEVREFPTFGPKALAGIGDLPGTLADRSLRIRLRRALPHERPERLLGEEPRETGEALRARAAIWAEAHEQELREARPAVPDELDDRAADACLPLLAIGDVAGGDWPWRIRAGVVALRAQEGEVPSIGVELLAAVRRAFVDAGDPEELATVELLERLAVDVEAPEGFDRDDKGRSRRLARLLRPFGVRSEDLHEVGPIGRRTRKGYRRGRFQDPFARYLPPGTGAGSAPSAPHGTGSGIPSSADPRQQGLRCGSANGGKPDDERGGADGADKSPLPGAGGAR